MFFHFKSMGLLQRTGPPWAIYYYPSFRDDETEARRPSPGRQVSHNQKGMGPRPKRRSCPRPLSPLLLTGGHLSQMYSPVCLDPMARGSLPAGVFFRPEAQKVPRVSGILFSPALEFFQQARQPPPTCVQGSAKSLSNVPQEKARPAPWAPRLARHHPLRCRMEIKHGGDKPLGGVEMSARHPEISSEHVTRRW